MTERIEEIEELLTATEFVRERPWLTRGERWAGGLLLFGILSGGAIEILFAHGVQTLLYPGGLIALFGWTLGMSVITGRDYWRFGFHRPRVTREQVDAWDRMLAHGYPRESARPPDTGHPQLQWNSKLGGDGYKVVATVILFILAVIGVDRGLLPNWSLLGVVVIAWLVNRDWAPRHEAARRTPRVRP